MDELDIQKRNKSLSNLQQNDLYFSDQEEDELRAAKEGQEKREEQQVSKKESEGEEQQYQENYQKQQLTKPYCGGCKQYYSCTSSLYLHIRTKHGGNPPQGTLGGPKGIIKKHLPYHSPHHSPPKHLIQQYKPAQLQYNDSRINQSRQQGSSNFRFRQQQQMNICPQCGKVYGSNTALKFHIKQKHPDFINNPNNFILNAPKKVFQCGLCGLLYGSKSALCFHMTKKHGPQQRQRNIAEQLPYNQQRIQKCGCGRTYESRSALKMHIKKKHKGIILKGTTEKGPRRTSQSLLEKLRNIQIQNHFRAQRSSSQEHSNSIYYSQDQKEEKETKFIEKHKSHPKYQPSTKIVYPPHIQSTTPIKSSKLQQPPVDPSKPFRCGCGRPYSCSSSLNLHIKKNHNWIVPYGTIGGPRGIRCQDETINQQQYYQFQPQILCDTCGQFQDNSYFKCQSCTNHYMCPVCFWGAGTENLSKEHDWILKDKQ